jgi:hypothetical protein
MDRRERTKFPNMFLSIFVFFSFLPAQHAKNMCHALRMESELEIHIACLVELPACSQDIGGSQHVYRVSGLFL